MAKLEDFIQVKTVQGTAVSTVQHTIIPESQFISLRFPFGGFVWHRPTAVIVQQQNQAVRQPINDVTRLAVWSWLAASILLPLVVRGFGRLFRSRNAKTAAVA